MGRVGKLPIQISDKIKVKFEENKVRVEGPKGMLEQIVPSQVKVLVENTEVKIASGEKSKTNEALCGTMRALINNMVLGVTNGYEKSMIIEGKGYRVNIENKNLILRLGYANPVEFVAPEGIEINTPDAHKIIVKGIDKQLVGNTAATIRAFKPPEPYKGKGIRYEGEFIRRKAGKKAGYGAGA